MYEDILKEYQITPPFPDQYNERVLVVIVRWLSEITVTGRIKAPNFVQRYFETY